MGPEIQYLGSDSGFANDVLTLKFLLHFDNIIKSSTKRGFKVLKFDNYGSFLTQNFVDYYWEKNIGPFQLPPLTSHLTQPCDFECFQKCAGEFKQFLPETVLIGGY